MAARSHRRNAERAGHAEGDGGPEAPGRGSGLTRTVLFLHSSAGRYGADLQLLALAGGLDRSRWRALAVLPERGELGPLLEAEGIEVVTHPLAVLRRGLMSPAGLCSITLRLRRDRRVIGSVARRREAAIVHSNTSVVLAGQAIARSADARHVLHVREIYEGAGPRPLWPLLRRRILRADAVPCISQAVAEQFGGAAGVEVLRDALPRHVSRLERSAARASLGTPAERFAVALVGRLSDWKGQDVLVRALAEPPLRELGALGLVAGDPVPGNERFERRLREQAAKAGVADRLRLLGFREDLETVLGAADALAVSSTRPEPLGLVALEAAAAGLPVVASAHGGLTEAVRDGQTGLLVPPGDAAALARALRRLADDPGEARRMGEAGAADVRRRFRRERMLAELEDLYERLLAVS